MKQQFKERFWKEINSETPLNKVHEEIGEWIESTYNKEIINEIKGDWDLKIKHTGSGFVFEYKNDEGEPWQDIKELRDSNDWNDTKEKLEDYADFLWEISEILGFTYNKRNDYNLKISVEKNEDY